MNKLLDTSRELLNDLQDTTATAATAKQLSDEGKGGVKGGGRGEDTSGEDASGAAAAVTVRPAEEILSGVKGLLRYVCVCASYRAMVSWIDRKCHQNSARARVVLTM